MSVVQESVSRAGMQECGVGSEPTSSDGTDSVQVIDLVDESAVDLREDRSQIRSRERVRDLAEVYTGEADVKAMLDLVPEMFESIDSTFLEPACGDGNFLVEILSRKCSLLDKSKHRGSGNWVEMAVLRCVASVYAIDISEDNVAESRRRLTVLASDALDKRGVRRSADFSTALAEILRSNVVLGDTLNGADQIEFVEWEVVDEEKFIRIPFPFLEPEIDLFYSAPDPLPPVHFSELGQKAKA